MSTSAALDSPLPDLSSYIAEFDVTLSPSQETALARLMQFVLDPEQTDLVLCGGPGCGKSTLLRYFLKLLPNVLKLMKIIDETDEDIKVYLTASTNKAAAELLNTTGFHAQTFYSMLRMILKRDLKTGKTYMAPTRETHYIMDSLVIIDEAFTLSRDALNDADKYLLNCKRLWVGDPDQLLPVNHRRSPLIQRRYASVELTENMRLPESSPIRELVKLARHAVRTNHFFSWEPDGEYVVHVDRETFTQMAIDAFSNKKSKGSKNKILAWRNHAVLGWNRVLKKHLSGTTSISVGDYVVCNSAVHTTHCTVKTDQTLQIKKIEPVEEYGLKGHHYFFKKYNWAFMPESVDEKKALLKQLKNSGTKHDLAIHNNICDNWIDLRDEFACTVDKSQGSTYDTVFIDFDDIGKCQNISQVARMIYVACSRPRLKIVCTGDI